MVLITPPFYFWNNPNQVKMLHVVHIRTKHVNDGNGSLRVNELKASRMGNLSLLYKEVDVGAHCSVLKLLPVSVYVL